MKKYTFADPNYHPKNFCDPTQCNEIIEKIEVALDSHPIDFVKIKTVGRSRKQQHPRKGKGAKGGRR